MFWLASINPGRKKGRRRKARGRKRTRSRRRKLSAWQREVKKRGGVMAAVKARRKAKKRRSTKKRRVFRRNRPRKVTRRSAMARTRRRRTPSRGRSGRFVRRRRRRRNPLYRKVRSGQYSGRRTRKRLHKIRGGRGWHNNPRRRRRRRRYRRNAVVPVSWNPPRRRRRRRRTRRNAYHQGYPRFYSNRGRHRRRSYRRNAVLPLSWNSSSDPIGGILGNVKRFIDIGFWTDYAIPAAGGFLGTKVVGKMVCDGIGKVVTLPTGNVGKVVRIGCDVLAASGLSWLAGRFLGRKYEEKVFVGGVVGITHTVLKELLGGTTIGKTIGLDGLGEDLSTQMKEAVAQRLEAELSGGRGVGAFLEERDLIPQAAIEGVAGNGVNGNMVGDFVTETALRMQPGYGPTGDLRDHEVASTETTL